MSLESWHLWVIGGVLLMGLEMLGLGFVALAIGVACLAGALAAYFGGELSLQIGSAVLAALLLTPLFVRGFRRFSRPHDRATLAGSGAAAGRPTPLVEQQGRRGVRITGDFFPAEAARGQAPGALQAGTLVTIDGFNGITAQVRIAQTTEE